jgi:hypothetical protein
MNKKSILFIKRISASRLKVKKIVYFLWKLKNFSAFLLLLFCGCSSSEKSSELLFLENVMIREAGLYVLMGSKPMSTFEIDAGFPETEEEKKRYYRDYLRAQNSASKQSLMSYEQFSKQCDNSLHFHYKHLWETWQAKMLQEVGPCYLFVARKNPYGERRKSGLFINVPHTLLTLKKYYQEFVEMNGAPFDPQQVLNEISDENSSFWEKAFHSNYTQGLLLGYGRKNAFAFSWQVENNIMASALPLLNEPTFKQDIAISDLQLPSVQVFSLGDEILETYKRERSQILDELKNKDFEAAVMQWLQKGRSKNQSS